MNQHKSIIVGVDYSDSSLAAIRQAIRIAAWNQSAIRVIHVLETLAMADVQEAMGMMAGGIVEMLLDDAKKQWKTFSANVPLATGLPFETEVNSAVAALARRGGDPGVGLLVLGARGLSGSKGAGPVAAGCVRRAPCDVLLVQTPHSKPFTTVIVGVDFSETSLRAVEQAIRIAIQDSAVLYIVHAYTSPWKKGVLTAKQPTEGLEAKYREALLARLQNFTTRLTHEMGYLKANYQVIEHESHGHGLGRFAAQIGADLVVVGKRGQTNLRDLFLGSTAERVLRDAPCSILAVHPPHVSR